MGRRRFTKTQLANDVDGSAVQWSNAVADVVVVFEGNEHYPYEVYIPRIFPRPWVKHFPLRCIDNVETTT